MIEADGRFVELRTYRSVSDPAFGIQLLVDDAGWFYLYKLIGQEGFGPYHFDELVKELEIEPTPFRVVALKKPSDRSQGR